VSIADYYWHLAPMLVCVLVTVYHVRRAALARKELDAERKRRRNAMDQAGAAIADAQDAHRRASDLRKKLAAHACPRCHSPRVARFCGNCGADQLPPGTPLAKGPDGRYRPAKAGDVPAGLVAHRAGGPWAREAP